MKWTWVISALTTAFRPDHGMDHEFVARHAKWQIENGCDGIVAPGSLGESATLTFDEKIAILETLARIGELATAPPHRDRMRVYWQIHSIRKEHGMQDHELTLDDVRRMAAEIGMESLTDGQLQELTRATRAARARRAALPLADLGPADEPAHVFRLAPGNSR